jgi:pilus assembly protein FimV
LLSRLRARGRASAISLGFLAVALAPQSWGLGLGEIELDSALNQEFSATIELYDASGLESGEILVSLGSSEDFERVGVERFFFLTGLDFQVGVAANGDPQIVVTSSRPITEPYLNFLVEVLWPNGRLLKEYTVLLDPPTFSEAAAPAVSAPAQNRSAGNTGRVQRVEPAAGSGTRVQMAPRDESPSQPSALDRGLSGDEYGMTDRSDTLWSIASRARPSNSVSVQQTMLAIAEMNPEAFINGNINLLKAGYVLKLPNDAQAGARSAEQALGEVARHDEEWRAYSRGEPLGEMTAERSPAPARSTADQTSELRSPVDASAGTTAANAVEATDGELRIVAEDGDSTTGVGGDAGSLAAALEETDKLGLKVEELTYALESEKQLASDQIAVRDRQIEVKDQQIAELQAQLAAAQVAPQQAAANPGAETQAQEPTPENQNQSAQADAAPWWQSPMVMYGGAGVLVLLLVGGMIAQRKRRAAEEENDYFDAEAAFADEERLEPAVGSLDDEDESELEEDFDTVATDAAIDEDSEDEIQTSQTSDVIGEADIYIAYGRYAQAIGLLLGVLEDEPERNDVRLKLLEVYAESGDRAAFDEHMTSLIEYCDDEEALLTARELENQFGEEAITLDDMMADEAGEVAPASESATAEGGAGGDLADLDFVARDSSAGAAVSESEEASAESLAHPPASDAAEEADANGALDFELELDDLDSTDSAGAAEAEAAGAGDQLGGDLGMDFDPDATDDAADTEETATAGIEYDTSEIEIDDGPESEELTIDADLEQAAATISEEAAEVSAGAALEEQGEVAVAAADDDPLDEFNLETAVQSDDEFDFEDEGDSANTKLDLARAYIDMGDADGARDILKEVMDEGNADQQQKAQSMLESL